MKLKSLFLQFYFDIALITDSNLSVEDRIENFIKALVTFTPIAFILSKLNAWFIDNTMFTIGCIVVILLNMVIGAKLHRRMDDFDIKVLLAKTLNMMYLVIASYFVLEVVLQIAGSSPVVQVFRIVIQISTILWPGGKILTNIYVLSDGQHPPKWVMERIYKFQTSGNLDDLLQKKKSGDQR